MSLRFKGDHIEDKQGNVLNLSYEDLLKECLSSQYNTLSIFEIVQEAVRRLTGEIVVRNNSRESILFMKLEAAIWNDEKYQTKKNEEDEKRKRLTTAKVIEERSKSMSFWDYQRKCQIKLVKMAHSKLRR